MSGEKLNNPALDLISLEEMQERWFLQLNFHKILNENPAESIPVSDSLGRVTACPVTAVHPSPSFYAASVDGLAVLSSKTFGVNEHNPMTLKIGRDGKFIATGNIMPEETDAVIPSENIKFLSINEVQISKFCAPWENVRPMGEEVAAREVIIPAHHKIRPLDIAAMHMGRVNTVNVVKNPRVGILPLGSTLVAAGTQPQMGKMVETSSHIIDNITRQAGGDPVIYDIVSENVKDLLKSIMNFIDEVDLLVILSGPSAGTKPVAEIMGKAGELVGYGTLVTPGMMSCFGVLASKPVIGLPGHAMSTLIMYEHFGLPIVYSKQGIKQEKRKTIEAYITSGVESPKGVDEFVRVSLGDVGGLPIAAPISRGANILMSLVRADGMVRIGPEKSFLKAGDVVRVELLRPENDLGKNVLIAGTYDLSFDILRNELLKEFDDVTMFSSNTGSMKGMMTLKAGHCHICSMHMFDDETGLYNIPFVKQFLSDMPLILVNIFHRKLGLLVAKNNPKNITSFEDLGRNDVKVINRIRGSGTRMVFDYYLRKCGIDLNEVSGYTEEAYTHLNLASAVASGNADVGLGILEAAKATGLDFVPLVPEQLDFVVPKQLLNSYPVRALLQVIASDSFKKELEVMGGYNASHTGKVIFEK
jgi:putative molybdopterin biosynthesis protein